MNEYRNLSIEFLQNAGINPNWAVLIQSAISLIIILLVAYSADRTATFIFGKIIPKIVGHTTNKWDDIFLENKVFSKFAHFIPGWLIIGSNELIASESVRWLIKTLSGVYFIVVTILFLSSIIKSTEQIYARIKNHEKSIRIYMQLAQVVLYSLGVAGIISIFANKNFIDILTGFGAMVTVLLIVYKDTILGFMAGIQLSANQMLNVGDWIVSPKDNADGTVIDIGLTTVKIQNWDRTITTIPTYKLVSESFTNWKGMQQSEGRRIKRHINIDMESIHFLSEEEIEKFKKIRLISEYIEEKVRVISEVNANETEEFNQRRLTNIGTFRKYIENYLRNSDLVNLDMMFSVRQLQPTEMGLPIEVYMFSKIKDFANYEQVQSDIFDHILAIVTTFNLRLFQAPSGNSFKNFSS